jgi:cytochrome oxidase Cu insertion factor (SCO1/SenC/PrrC family)
MWEEQLKKHKILNRTRLTISILFLGLNSLLLSACNSSDLIKVGDPAPGFTLQAASGDEISLSKLEGNQPVLLYFHMAKG